MLARYTPGHLARLKLNPFALSAAHRGIKDGLVQVDVDAYKAALNFGSVGVKRAQVRRMASGGAKGCGSCNKTKPQESVLSLPEIEF